MTTKQIFDLAIRLGMKADLRGPAQVKKYLEHTKKKYDKLEAESKGEYDADNLTNPYNDSRILVDNGRREIKKILAGIDIGGGELFLADKLGDVGLVICHHPIGKALADLSGVMDLQAQVLADYGVPINIAESVIKPRISEVGRRVSSANYNQPVDMARALGLDLICAHTPCDNLGVSFINNLLKRKKPEFIGDIVSILKEIPEYAQAVKYNSGVKIYVGSPDNSCGKIALTEFCGGTSGAKEMYEKMAQAGIGTVIGMHMPEEHRAEAEKYHINVIIADHMASDSLGMNLYLDEVEKKGIKVIPIAGFIRVNRSTKK